MSETRKPSVLLVDGYSLIFRAFHALPLMVTKDGTYTNAVHGFFSMLLKALGDYRPEALCVMLDVHAPTFRHTLYPDYKGTRKPMPEELRPQLPLMREVLKAMHLRWRATKPTTCLARRRGWPTSRAMRPMCSPATGTACSWQAETPALS